MRRLSIVTSCFSLFILSLSTEAEARSYNRDHLYASGYFGLHSPSDNDSDVAGIDEITWETGYRFGGRVGLRSGKLRYEGEAGYRAADGELEFDSILLNDLDVELSVLQASFNIFYDVAELSLGGIKTTPYVGGGVGYANVEFDGDVVDDESGGVLLVEGGLTIRLGSTLSIVPAYRYEYVAVEILNEDALTAHALQIGARLDF